MYLNILKKDLKRKKTMNMILLVFIILATMFVASGLNNVFTVMNGTDYYLDKAEIGDFVEVFPAKIRQWRVGIYVQQRGKAVLRDAGGIDKAAAPVRLTAVRVGHIAVAVRRVAVSQLGLPEGGH